MPPVGRPQRRTRVPDIRQGDEVLVLTGKDAGKRGTVTKVITNQQGWKKSTARYGAGWQKTSPLAGAAVVVDGVNVAKRHTKPRARAGATERQPRVQQGGIVSKEAAIHVSNVAHIDPKDGKPTRVGFKFLEDGRKVRYAKRSGEILDR